MTSALKNLVDKNSAQTTLQAILPLRFRRKLDYHCKVQEREKIDYKIRAQYKQTNSQIQNWFILQFYKLIKKWRAESFYFPQKLSSIDNSLLRISHIAFVDLKSLNITVSDLNSIQAVSWIQSPHLQRLVLNNNKILSLKPLSKSKQNSLIYLDIRQNKFNHKQLGYLSRSLGQKIRQRNDYSVFLTQPMKHNNLGDFTPLIKCSLKIFMTGNKQLYEFELKAKEKLRSKNNLGN